MPGRVRGWGWGGCLGEGPWLAPVRVPTPQLQKHCRPPTSAPGAFWESGADPPRGPAYPVLSQVWLRFKGFAQAGLWVFRARAAPHRAPVPWPVGAHEAATLQTLLTSQHGAIHPVPSQGRNLWPTCSPAGKLPWVWPGRGRMAAPHTRGAHAASSRILPARSPTSQWPRQTRPCLMPRGILVGAEEPAVAEPDKGPGPNVSHASPRGREVPGRAWAVWPLVLLPSPPIPTPLLGLRAPPPRLGKVPDTTVPTALGQLGSVTSVRTQERTRLCPGVGTACILPVRKPHSRPWLP